MPRDTEITRDEFIAALYDPNYQSDKPTTSLNYLKKQNSICLVKSSRKALNAAYSKMRVASDLRTCFAWDQK